MGWQFLEDDEVDDDVLSDEQIMRQTKSGVRGGPSVLSPVHRLFRSLAKGLSVLFGFVWRWYWTRPKSAFWWGMPAVVVGCGMIGLVAFARQTRPAELITTYNEKAFAAFRAEDFEAADLYFQKLLHLNSSNKDTLYGLALSADRQENTARAVELMQRLAPSDGNGDERAHFWLAKHLAQQDKKTLDVQGVALLEHHLLQTVSESPNHVEANRMLTSLYASRKQFDKAASYLGKVADKDPAALLTLARLQVMADHKAVATRTAEGARDHFEEKSTAEPANPVYRLQWAEAELFLVNFQRAAEIALIGLQQANADNHTQWKNALTTIFLTWYDATTKSEADNLSKRLELLQQALGFGPTNPQVLSRLAEFAVQDNEQSTVAMTELKQILAAGRAPGIVHFILGTAALGSDEEQQGLHHLELAFAQLPQMPAAANNLAWALANGAEPNLDSAAQLINAAIKLSPQHPEIRETRGQILAKQGKTKEAIVDLEFVLRSQPQRTSIHTTLATLYDELGDAELADRHREMAEQAAIPSQ
jgi:tetratricopeptide (TPR) repeat protein